MSNKKEDILTIDQLVHQDDWVSDSERYRCHVCTRNFNLGRRRHHCRRCGEVVCRNCTLYKEAELPVVGRSKVRVCMSCILSQTNGEEEQHRHSTEKTSSISMYQKVSQTSSMAEKPQSVPPPPPAPIQPKVIPIEAPLPKPQKAESPHRPPSTVPLQRESSIDDGSDIQELNRAAAAKKQLRLRARF